MAETVARPSSPTWSYDLKHPPTSTLTTDPDFKPVLAEVPPEVEKSLCHKHTPPSSPPLTAASPSTSEFVRKKPVRKPTASYGVDPVTGELDPNATGVNELTEEDVKRLTTETPEEVQRRLSQSGGRPAPPKRPVRKPTVSYGDEVTSTE